MTDSSNFSNAVIVEGDEKPVVLLEITHPGLTSAIRVVNDNKNLKHIGNEYIAIAFGLSLPTQKREQFTRATLWIDRYSDIIVDWIELSRGAKGAAFVIKQVIRSRPATIEMQLSLVAKSVRYTADQISADLGYAHNFTRGFCAFKFNPQTAPGLFV